LTEEQKQIDAFPSPYKRQTIDCKAPVRVYAHKDRGSGAHHWYVPEGACHKANCCCPWCIARNGRERADRVRAVYDRLWSLIPDSVPRFSAFVFTLPSECRTDDLEKLKEVRHAARLVASQWLLDLAGLDMSDKRRPGWELSGFDVYHPEGDRDPGVWKPHIHMQIPALAHRRGDVKECGFCRENWYSRDLLPPCDSCRNFSPRWQAIRVRVSPLDLRNLRYRWGRELNRLFGWKPPTSQNGKIKHFERCAVDYKWRTAALPGQYHHRIKYDVRHWPQYQGSFRSVTWFGYLAPASQKRIGLPPNEKREKPKEPFTQCPECGILSDVDFSLGTVRKVDDLTLKRAHAPPWVVDAKKAERLDYAQNQKA